MDEARQLARLARNAADGVAVAVAPSTFAGSAPAARGSASGMRNVRCNVCSALGDHYSSACPERGKVGIPRCLQKTDAPDASPMHRGAVVVPAGPAAAHAMHDRLAFSRRERAQPRPHAHAHAHAHARAPSQPPPQPQPLQPPGAALAARAPPTSPQPAAALVPPAPPRVEGGIPGEAPACSPAILQSATMRAMYIDRAPDFLPTTELAEQVRRRMDVPPALRCYACGLLAAAPVVWASCCDIVLCKECLGPVAYVGVSVCPKCEHVFGEPPPEGLALTVRPLAAMVGHWARAAMETVDVYAARAVSAPHMAAVLEREFSIPTGTAAAVVARLLQLALRADGPPPTPAAAAEYVFVARRR
jgi:hypothetical protein